MTNYTTLSDSELTEALNFHRRQRNMSRGINEAAHARQTQIVRMIEAEEARRLNEEKPNHYVIYKHKDKYGVSQNTGTGYNWDHSYHHGYHDTIDSAKAWAAKHAGKYPHKIEVKEETKIGKAGDAKLVSYGPKGDKVTANKIANHIAKRANDYTGGNAELVKKLSSEVAKHGDTTANDLIKKHKTIARNVGMDAKAAHNLISGSASALKEEVEQIDEISTELKKRYVEKGADDVVDRFTSRGKYERPYDPSKYTKTGRPKKSAVNSPEAVKYRAKLDNRSEIVNKVSQEVHGKKRFGEEFEINEASDLRITKIYNKWPKKATYAVHTPDRKYFKEFDSIEAAKAHHDEKTNNK